MEQEVVTELLKCEETNAILQAFCEGGYVTMFGIAIIGALSLGIIIERFLKIQKLTVDKTSVNENLFAMILRGDIKQAIAFCDSRPSALTNTLKAGLVQVLNKRPDEEVQVSMDASVLRETPRLEGWSSFLAVFGNVSVLFGLVGTIFGLIKAFGAVSEADPSTKAQILSQGISHALNCTAFGLMVAIMSIIAFGFFQLKIGRAINEMAESSMTMMNLVVANRDKIKY